MKTLNRKVLFIELPNSLMNLLLLFEQQPNGEFKSKRELINIIRVNLSEYEFKEHCLGSYSEELNNNLNILIGLKLVELTEYDDEEEMEIMHKTKFSLTSKGWDVLREGVI